MKGAGKILQGSMAYWGLRDVLDVRFDPDI